MAQREVGQLSLADALVERVGKNASLARIAALLDWAPLAALLAPLHASPLGRKSYPTLVMLKATLLQQWYGLSDPGLEDALADRLSFRRFCGLALDDDTPDHVTIHRFREALVKHDLAEPVFAEVNRQIDAQGLIVRKGTLIDASLIEAAVKRPKPPAATPAAPAPAGAPGAPSAPAPSPAPDASSAPAVRAASKLVKSPHDPDAAWAKKGGKRYFGYKVHVGVDQGSGLIRTQLMIPANINDTVPADDLICGDEKAVYADQAYDTKRRRAALKARGVKDRLMHRPNKHHPLTPWQTRRNKAIGKRRGPVEQVFARLKRLYGWTRVRYCGLMRNSAHFTLLCTALNLKRWATLCAA
jgi:transposase, IS5 family